MWRRHQQECIDVCNEILSGEPVDKVYIDAHPGSGKSGDSILFAKHLIGKFVDRVCHVAPRKSLVYQIERDMLDPFFESGRVIRAADNGADPSRGTDGFAITFQAIASNADNLVKDFQRHRYILVLDEHHHCSDDGSWEAPVEVLMELAVLTVFMTGTAYRGDGGPISFFPYKNGRMDKTNSKSVRHITYTRRDALEENAIIPVKLDLIDGSGSYYKGSKLVEYENMHREHLQAALRGDYAFQVIDAKLVEFLVYKGDNPLAQMIIVGPDIETSRAYADYISEKWCRCVPVDSRMPNSSYIIGQFRDLEFPILSSCNQAYEGLDAPNTSHMIILTTIRSGPWLTQCINRATRNRQWKDYAYISAPADAEFTSFFREWIWEQEQVLDPEDNGEGGSGGGGGGGRPEIDEIASQADLPPSAQEDLLRAEINQRINRYVGENAMKKDVGIVHTESMRRRKILWYKIYLGIGRKCQLKEMTMEEMQKALEIVNQNITVSVV